MIKSVPSSKNERKKIRLYPFSLKDILGIKDKKIGYNKINQIAFATNLQIDKNNQIINFDIPKPTKNKKSTVCSWRYNLPFPDFQPFSSPFRGYSESLYFRNIDTVGYIPIFKNKIDINNQLIGSVDRFRHLEDLNLEIEIGKFVDTPSDKLLLNRTKILNTSVWFLDDEPLEKKWLMNAEKDDLFD